MPWLRFLERALEALFPTRCVACGRDGELFCDACRAALVPSERSLPDTLSLYPYREHAAARLVWALKYERLGGVGEIMAGLMSEPLVEELGERLTVEGFERPLLTVVPASARRLRRYRKNHLDELGRSLAGRLGLEYEPSLLLVAAEPGAPQMSLPRAARLTNVAGAFRARHGALPAIAGRNLLVLDDVTTTGATLSEACRALTEAGARRVLGLTFAY